MDRRDFLKYLSALAMTPLLEGGASPMRTPRRADEAQEKPNVIILLFDTLAARHMSLHGYRRLTVPNMARFADRATVYHSHRATGNFTTPSTASLLTGVYPWTHRGFQFGGNLAAAYNERHLFSLLPDGYQRLLFPHHLWIHLMLQQFRDKGDVQYVEPAAFSLTDRTFPEGAFRDVEGAQRSFEDLLFRTLGIPGSLFFGLDRDLSTLSLRKKFAREFGDLYPRGIPTLGMYDVFFLLEDLIDGIKGLLAHTPQPFVAYVHIYPPHDPYCARHDFVGMFDDGWAPAAKPQHPLSQGLPQEQLDRDRIEYDEYVAFVDAEFGRLYDFMVNSSLLDHSYLVVTSDHGEMFERGVLKHVTETLYEPVIHVPLLISAPGQGQRVDVYEHTSGIDLMPTLLDAVGAPVPEWCQGRVLPTTEGATTDGDRPIYSMDAKLNAAFAPLTTYTMALLHDRYKLIHYAGHKGYEDVYELYDLENDPGEREDLYDARRPLGSDLAVELHQTIEENDTW